MQLVLKLLYCQWAIFKRFINLLLQLCKLNFRFILSVAVQYLRLNLYSFRNGGKYYFTNWRNIIARDPVAELHHFFGEYGLNIKHFENASYFFEGGGFREIHNYACQLLTAERRKNTHSCQYIAHKERRH